MTEANDGAPASSEVLRLVRLVELRPDREQLRPFLAHPDPVVRQTAVDVVAELRPAWGFDPLCLALLDAEDRVRVAAAEGLRALQSLLPDQPQLFDFLEQALESPSPAAREVAVRLLRRTSDAGVATFVSATGDPQPRVRIEAVRALVGFHAGPEICALENDADPTVRAEVARSLGQIADARGIETLRRLALDDEPAVRAAAITAIPAVCPRGRCGEALVLAARDADGEVRKAAATALARSAFEASTPALLRLATDSAVEVRQAALAALATRGVSAPATWRVLLDATHDADHRVRAIARSVLRRTPERVA